MAQGIKSFFPSIGSKFNSCHDNLGQFCSGGSGFINKVSVDTETTNEEFAKQQINDYLTDIPESIQKESSIKTLEVFENPEDATYRMQELHGKWIIDEDELIRGAYDRDTRKAIVSLYYADDAYLEVSGMDSSDLAYSGRNFYHEFAHSLENKITSNSWGSAWHEWDLDQDEGFATAFASYMVGKRLARLGSKEELKNFKTNYPKTTEVFRKWGM